MPAADLLQDKSVTLLRALSTPDGIRASLETTANYDAIFTRDAVMAGIAGLVLDDRTVIDAFVRTLEQLRELQGTEGQIASNYVRDGVVAKASFGALVPRIDACTWYLLGIAFAARAGIIDGPAFASSVQKTVQVLDALEYNGRHLIYIPAGGNWADEYVYDGYILYDQVLRSWALCWLGDLYRDSRWITKAGQIEGAIAARYWPDESRRAYPIAAFSPIARRDTFDLAACSLLAIAGIEKARAARALDWVDAQYLEQGKLPPVFHPVIDEVHPDWPALRRYHLYQFRNVPHQYHNGGIWPIWLGWLGVALARSGREHSLVRLRDVVGSALRAAPSFEFNEYLHGVTGAPGGMSRMAYSAAGLVLLEHADSPALDKLFRS